MPSTRSKAKSTSGRSKRSTSSSRADGRKRAKSGTKYGEAASRSVERALHKEKKGTLRSGSGDKVTSRKQAIAIGLSEARRKGAKVPAQKDDAS